MALNILEEIDTGSTGDTVPEGFDKAKNNFETLDGLWSTSRPAFYAKPTSDQTDIATDTTVKILFGTELHDNNDDFDSSLFTAPAKGLYHFDFAINLEDVDTAATSYNVYLLAGGVSYYNIFEPKMSSDYETTVTYSITVQLNADQTAGVYIYQQGGGGSNQTDITTYSMFSGFLVCYL